MTLHIILATIFIICFAISIFLVGLYGDKHDWIDPICTFVIITLAVFTTVSGAECHREIHYREMHKPTIEDVNNGYAEIVEYKCISDKDTSIVYVSKWLGNNQDGEREINNK